MPRAMTDSVLVPAPGASRLLAVRGEDDRGEVLCFRLDDDLVPLYDRPHLGMLCRTLHGEPVARKVGWNDGRSREDQVAISLEPDGTPLIHVNVADPGKPPEFFSITLDHLRRAARYLPDDEHPAAASTTRRARIGR